jgi:hypothetical protein
MKREIAEPIIKAMKSMDLAINQLTKAVRAIEDEDERKRMLMFIAGVIHESHMQITLPVVKHFPELHPDIQHMRER